LDEDAAYVFQKLKKIRFRNKWDINLKSFHKNASLENSKIKVKNKTISFLKFLLNLLLIN